MEMTRGPSSDERLIELLEPLLVTVERPCGLCQYRPSVKSLRGVFGESSGYSHSCCSA
jgi:hypothetical protein